MTIPALESRALGCLIGLACGDALGGPVEFLSRSAIAAAHPGGLRDFVGGGWLNLSPGEITDDTQMTLDLARALVANDPIDMADLAARFVAWAAGGPKDIGNTTQTSIDRLARGLPWDQAGENVYRASLPQGAAGNGSVMRCAPVALRYFDDRPKLRQVSIDTARITHADPRCIWGAVAVNQAIAGLLSGAQVTDVRALAGNDLEHPELSRAIDNVSGLAIDSLRSGGYVVDTVAAALWCVVTTSSLEEAIVTAVNLGDDADTTGAVTGAIAGACYGVESIPCRWYEQVQHRDELESLARLLISRGGS